jgi:hypothetical protein
MTILIAKNQKKTPTTQVKTDKASKPLEEKTKRKVNWVLAHRTLSGVRK